MAGQLIAERLGVCSWSLEPRNPRQLIDQMRRIGLNKINLALAPLVEDAVWSGVGQALQEGEMELIGGMLAGVGEDYSTLESIRRTGGVVPDQAWPQVWARARRAAPVARDLGLDFVMFHAGFLPHETDDPVFKKVVDRVRRIADLFAEVGVSIGLETGQEQAPTLLQFFQTLDRPNVGVNFDPANMILYNSGDPIQALRTLGTHIRQVHIKDANRTHTPGKWGEERVVGTGEVDWGLFFQTLDELGYEGYFAIEREAGQSRVDDIRTAKEFVLGKG